jgi:hypothetical protein
MIRYTDHPHTEVMIDTFYMTLAEADLAAVIHAAGKNRNRAQISENHFLATDTARTSLVAFCDTRRKAILTYRSPSNPSPSARMSLSHVKRFS